MERLHRTLKASIMARQKKWYQSLPVVLLGMHMTPSCTGLSPFTAVTGAFMLCPHPIISKNPLPTTTNQTINVLIQEMQNIDFANKASGIIKSFLPKDLMSCQKVWLRVDRVRKSLEAPYTAPYDVISRYEKHFVVKLPKGNTTVRIDRLKVARLPE